MAFCLYRRTICTPGNAPSYCFFRWILQYSNVSDVQIWWVISACKCSIIFAFHQWLWKMEKAKSLILTQQISNMIFAVGSTILIKESGSILSFDIKRAGLGFIVWLFAHCGIFSALCACMTLWVYTGWLNVGSLSIEQKADLLEACHKGVDPVSSDGSLRLVSGNCKLLRQRHRGQWEDMACLRLSAIKPYLQV